MVFNCLSKVSRKLIEKMKLISLKEFIIIFCGGLYIKTKLLQK